MSRNFRILCGVPREFCNGQEVKTDQTLSQTQKGKLIKCHTGRAAAFSCMRRYMKTQGWRQVGSKEFAPPNGGPIRVLTRPGRYGARLRAGKGSKEAGSRYMPARLTGGAITG